MIIAEIAIDMIPRPFKTFGDQVSFLNKRLTDELAAIKLPHGYRVHTKGIDGYHVVYSVYCEAGRLEAPDRKETYIRNNRSNNKGKQIVV